MCKEDLALNNQQGVIYHKTQPKQTKPNIYDSVSARFSLEEYN